MRPRRSAVSSTWPSGFPGKEEFAETLRYFSRRIELTGVRLHLNTPMDVERLKAEGYDEVILATGVLPRVPDIPGLDHPKALSYVDVLLHRKPVGARARSWAPVASGSMSPSF